MRQRLICRGLVPSVVQPAVPIRINSACFHRAIVNNPAAVARGIGLEHVALAIFANLLALAPCPKLSAKCLPVPPCENALDCVEKAHRSLLDAACCAFARKTARGPVRYAFGSSAVSSISILYLGSIKSADIIVAAGGLSPNAADKTGQHGSKSARLGRI